MKPMGPEEQGRIMFQNVLERYRAGLEKLKKEGAPPSQIAYVEKCIKNIEDLPIMKKKPEFNQAFS